MKTKHEIQKSNLLIEASYNIPSVDGYRLTLMGMSAVCMNLLQKPDDKNALIISLKTKDIQALFPSLKNAKSFIHQRIDKATDAIGNNNTVKIYQKDDGNWKKAPFIMDMTYNNYETLIIRFNEEIRHLFNPKSEFTRYLLNDTAQLRSYQQIRIYELCAQYIKVGTRTIDIPTFKKFIGIKKKKITSDLIRELKACITQINQKTNLEVEFEPIKTSRKITHIKFIISSTDTHPLDVINHKENDLKTQLVDLGFKQEKLKSLLKLSPNVLIQAIKATKKSQIKGFKKSMESCFFYNIGISKDNKLSHLELVLMFKENLSIVKKNDLWNEFYLQLSEDEQATYSEGNKQTNKIIKQALNIDSVNKYNKWIYETKIKPQQSRHDYSQVVGKIKKTSRNI